MSPPIRSPRRAGGRALTAARVGREDFSSTITERRFGLYFMALESMILWKIKKNIYIYIYQGFILIESFKRVYLEKSFLKSVDIS